MIAIQLTKEELSEMISEAVRQALDSKDRALTRHEAAEVLGKSVMTIDRMKARGDITPINPEGHPRFSYNELMGIRKKFATKYAKSY